MEFVTFPKLPVIQVAPINVALLATMFLMLLNISTLPRINGCLVSLIGLLMFYALYDYALGMLLNKPDVHFPASSFRSVIELALFCVACRTDKDVLRAMHFIGYGALISAIVGLLIYLYGEPWLGIRNWLLQSTNVSKGVAGKGLWITGLSGEHFLFGYLIATAPVVALINAQSSRIPAIWYGSFFMLVYALYINAERGAVLCCLMAVVFLAVRWRLLSPFKILAAASLALLAVVYKSSVQVVSSGSLHGTSLIHRFESGSSLGERMHWLMSGINAVLDNPFSGVSKVEYARVFYNRNMHLLDLPNDLIYVHNHYITPGMNVGVVGWVMVIIFLLKLQYILRYVYTYSWLNTEYKALYQGIPVALVTVMAVALFHNTGLFNNEPTTICLMGVLFAAYQVLAQHQADAKIHAEQHLSQGSRDA